MFEKEAYEWTEKNISVGISMYNPSIEMYCGKAFQDGAEFGYNKAEEDADKMKSRFLELCNLKDMRIAELEKANEWHYVKDELYTKSWKRYNKYLVIARFTTETGKSDVPLLAYFDHYQQKWYVDRTYLCAFNVIAWKEIVLPELKESE